MKKTFVSMVLLMVLGTSTSFGKTNGQPREMNNQPRMEMRQDSRDNQPRMMDNRKGEIRGQHKGDFRMEPVRHMPEPRPVPQPEPRPVMHTDPVTTGVVVGTVVGSIISSLVK